MCLPAAREEAVVAVPFPRAHFLLVLFVCLADGVVITFLVPMVPFMVRDFGVPEAQVGSAAGLVASVYNLAQIFSGLLWGRASDLIGRRPVISFGIVAAAASTLGLGVATSLPAALATRFVGGLLNANQAVLRAQLRELMPEEHRSQAFASLGQAWGVGFMLGPLIGGSLARPAAVLPSLAGSPLDVYPYLLPSLAAAALCLLGLPAVRALPETVCVGGDQPSCLPGTELPPSSDQPRAGAGQPAADAPGKRRTSRRDLEMGTAPSLPGHEAGEEGAAAEAALPGRRHLATAAHAALVAKAGERSSGERRRGGGGGGDTVWTRCWGGRCLCPDRRRCFLLMRRCCSDNVAALGSLGRRQVRLCIALMAINHFTVIGMAELFPLFASAPTGLRMQPQQIGAALTPLAVALCVWPFVFVRLERRHGPVATLRIGQLAFAMVNATMPLLVLLRDSPLLWVGLVAVGLCRGIGGNSSFPSLAILLNSMLDQHLGAMNGFAASVGSLVRAIAPVACGSLFSAASSISESPEVAQGLPFYLLVALLLCGLGMTAGLSRPGQPGSEQGAAPASAARAVRT